MKLRTYITAIFGGIKNAIRGGSQVAAVVQAVDQRVGRQGAHGKRKQKSPFRGIACSHNSSYGLRFYRHVEGARDTRPSFHTRRRKQILRKIFIGEGDVAPFRDVNPAPFSFTE